jgi:hypothetical protein
MDDMRRWPKRWPGRALLAAAVATVVASWTWYYRPWEAHFMGRPTSYWAGWAARQSTNFMLPPSPTATELRVNQILAPLGVQWHPGPSVWEVRCKPEAIPVLIELLANKDSHVRGVAAELLRELKPPPEQAIPALLRAWQMCKDDRYIGTFGETVSFRDIDATCSILNAIQAIDPEAIKRAEPARDETPGDKPE